MRQNYFIALVSLCRQLNAFPALRLSSLSWFFQIVCVREFRTKNVFYIVHSHISPTRLLRYLQFPSMLQLVVYPVGGDPLNYSSSKLNLPSCRFRVPFAQFPIAIEAKARKLLSKCYFSLFPYFISYRHLWAPKSCSLSSSTHIILQS
jgi:hypothetical protein